MSVQLGQGPAAGRRRDAYRGVFGGDEPVLRLGAQQYAAPAAHETLAISVGALGILKCQKRHDDPLKDRRQPGAQPRQSRHDITIGP